MHNSLEFSHNPAQGFTACFHFMFLLITGDIVDNILANLIDTNRTRRHVIRQLIIMDLVTDSKQLKKGISGKSRTANQWTEEQQADLINLYESHRNDAGKLMDQDTDYLIVSIKKFFYINRLNFVF